ncbi:MAG: two-component regulator propeller domain-containing protein [Bacteroidota bacterium]
MIASLYTMRFSFFVFFILTITHLSLQANPVLYDDGKGLSNNQITEIIKDKTGIMWIATESGLNKYDGYTFTEINELKGYRINTIYFDSAKNALWIGCNKGLHYYNISTGLLEKNIYQTNASEVIKIIAYNQSKYIVFMNGTIVRIGSNLLSKEVFSLLALGLQNATIKKSIAHDQKGNIIFTSNKFPFLISLQLATGKCVILKEYPSQNISSLTSAKDYYVILYNSGGYRVLPTSVKPTAATLAIQKSQEATQHIKYHTIYIKDNEVYATQKGYHNLYYLVDGQWQTISAGANFQLSSKTMNTMYLDDFMVLWLGTNKGLIKVPYQTKYPFTSIFSSNVSPISIRQIVEAKNNDMFIATYKGIYQYNTLTHYTKNIVDSIFPFYTRAICLDTGNYLYAGTESTDQYFYRYNIKTKKYEGDFYKLSPLGAQINSVFSIYRDKHNTYWLATDKGLASYNPKDRLLKLHIAGKYSIGSIKLFYINASKNSNKFWVCGLNAVYLIDIDNGVSKEYKANVNSKTLIPADDYIFVAEDKNQIVWLGTKKSGLIKLDYIHNQSLVINKSKGLSSNEVYGLISENQSIAWVSTANGLCRYDIQNNTFTNYFIDNGLTDNEFNQNALYKHSSGQFYFGGINGINIINPRLFKPHNPALAIFTASIHKWNQSDEVFKEVKDSSVILMKPDDHLLTFTFGLSDYNEVETNTFFYRIKGLYNEWISLGNQNQLRLEGLSAGEYMVEIIGFNRAGMQASSALLYKVKLAQVYYKTWWFYVLLACTAILLIFAYFRWHLNNINQKQQLRTQIASNLHDEVGSLLTSIIMSTDSARYSSSNIDDKNLKLEKISALSRNATNTMSDVLWSIDARNDYAGNLTDRMREHAEMMLFPLNIDLVFDFTETQQQKIIKADKRQQLYLIFKEAINNIAKHSQATFVKIIYKQKGNHFELVIENDYKATPADLNTSSGQGLRNIKMRAQKINAECIILTQKEIFTIKITGK